MQRDDIHHAGEWYKDINDVISELNQRGSIPPTPVVKTLMHETNDSSLLRRSLTTKGSKDSNSGTSTLPLSQGASKKDAGKIPKAQRSRSIRDRMRLMGGSTSGDELDGLGCEEVSSEGAKQGIKDRLLKFFLRRPTMDEVFKRGILKNPPVFGSTLEELHRTDFPQVHVHARNFYTPFDSKS